MATYLATREPGPYKPGVSFSGCTVAAFESRRAVEIAKLIEHAGGLALVGPTLREASVHDNSAAMAFGEALFSAAIDMHICLTGVGTRMLLERLESRWPRADIVAALAKTQMVVRGPKPIRVLNEYGIPIAIRAPEPNTWREIMKELAAVPMDGRRVWVQEYGIPNAALCEALRARGAEVHTVKVYSWALPTDVGPLVEVLRALAQGQVQVAMFTSAQQVAHLFLVAAQQAMEEPIRSAFRNIVIGSIGPTCTESLEAHGLRANFEPSHPRMGLLVSELAEHWQEYRREL